MYSLVPPPDPSFWSDPDIPIISSAGRQTTLYHARCGCCWINYYGQLRHNP